MDDQEPANNSSDTSSILIGGRRYTVAISPDPATPDMVVVDLIGDGQVTGRLSLPASALPDLGALFTKVLAGRPDQAPRPVMTVATRSGVYNTLLEHEGGGPYSTPAEERLAQGVMKLVPESRHFAPSALTAVLRATKAAVADGITQILDLGHGLPTSLGLVHEVAQAINPQVRYVGVDIDQRTVDHMWAKIPVRDSNTEVFKGDYTDIDGILAHPHVKELLNFDEKMLVLAGLATQYIPDDLLRATTQAYYDLLAPGSRMMYTMPCADIPEPLYTRCLQVVDLYDHPEKLDDLLGPSSGAAADASGESEIIRPKTWLLRSVAEIEDVLAGLENVTPPGIVPAWLYRPDLEPLHPVSDEHAKLWGHAMVALEIHRP